MLVRFFLSLLNPPSRLRDLGATLFHIGLSLCAVGIVLQACSRIVAVTQKMGNAAVPESAVAYLLPSLPTWFVPESLLGIVFWAAITAVGWCCQSYAKDFERAYLR